MKSNRISPESPRFPQHLISIDGDTVPRRVEHNGSTMFLRGTAGAAFLRHIGSQNQGLA